jgi:dolichol-phosphate mannosyltransferase
VKTLVIVPTYNERENVDALMARFLDAVDDSVHLLVIDDSSPDGTAAVVRILATARSGIFVIDRPGKQGLASAYVTGFRWALERDYDAVVEMDADLSHDPAVVPALIAALGNADLVIGSRYVEGGRLVNWSRFRELLSKAGNVYARAWLGFDVRDSTSGFRAYRCETLAALDLETVRAEGYSFQIEMAYRIHRKGGRIAEIPITFTERRHGRSKLSRRIVVEALWRVPLWAVRHRILGRR